MDAEPQRADQEDRGHTQRESHGGVLGIGAALLVIALAAIVLMVGRVKEIDDDGEALLAEGFASVDDLPWGFAAVRAMELPGGQKLVLFADPSEPLPDPPDVSSRGDSGGGGHGGGGRGGGGRGGGRRGRDRRGGGHRAGGGGGFESEWLKVVEGAAAPPVEATLVWYPLTQGDQVLKRLFGAVQFKDIGRLEDEGELVAVDSGHLDWSGLEAPYVRMRDYRKSDGERTFHDTLRVNISVGSRPCVLYMRWAEGVPGSSDDAESFLARLEPRT